MRRVASRGVVGWRSEMGGGWAETIDTGEAGHREWWVLVPAQFLVDGRNQIEVWEVTSTGEPEAPITLRPVASG